MSPTRRWARRVPEEVKVTGVVRGTPPSRGSSDGRNPKEPPLRADRYEIFMELWGKYTWPKI